MNDVDILKFAINAVSEVLGGDLWVADHLPPADVLEELTPAVTVDLLSLIHI